LLAPLEQLLLAALSKLAQTEHLPQYAAYLRGEWLNHPEDLLLALGEEKVWAALKLPARLKMELALLVREGQEGMGQGVGQGQDRGQGQRQGIGAGAGIGAGDSPKRGKGDRAEGRDRKGAYDTAYDTGAEAGAAWVRVYAEEHQCCYFYNTVTQESSWEDPRTTDSGAYGGGVGEGDAYPLYTYCEST
ncbi:hypothetical protein B484DRAFT_439114, partial [Ochromonadaceae sp. CCMP2298]